MQTSRLIAGALLASALAIASGSSKAADEDIQPADGNAPATVCPATELLYADASGFSEVDSVFLSLAELNGYLDGVPKLTFDTGSSRLAGQRRNCLRQFAQIYVRAVRGLGGEDRRNVALRFIGHADAIASSGTNFRLSFRRASGERDRFLQYVGQVLDSRPRTEAEGRGELEPWWCGAARGGCDFPGAEEGTGPVTAAEAPVDNDRRLEIRFEGASISGPRLRVLLASLEREQQATRARFVERPRYYPRGTAPLHPVEIRIGGDFAFEETGKCRIPPNWFDSGWIAGPTGGASRFEPAGSGLGKRFDEGLIFARLRVIPLVGQSSLTPERGRLVLQLATGIVSPEAPDETGPGEALEAAEASTASAPAPKTSIAGSLASSSDGPPAEPATPTMAAPRYGLGLGVPDYWRARLRLGDMLMAQTGKADLLEIVGNCQGKTSAEALLQRIRTETLRSMPRDFDGLLGEAYDFNRPMHMFGLRAGHTLRVDSGRFSLPTGDTAKFNNLATFGNVENLHLYAAPLGLRNNPAELPDDTSAPAKWPARSGPFGHLAVTLNPTVQSIWQDVARNTDTDELPYWEFDEAETAHPLGNALALERFLRGRVVRVLVPVPRDGDSGRSLAEQKLTFSKPPAITTRRDTVLLAAEDPAVLDAFAQAFQTGDLVGDQTPLCKRFNQDTDRKVLCGYFRHNVLLSLLIGAEIGGRNHAVPIDTRVGSLMTSAQLRPCFASSAGDSDKEFVPYDAADRLRDETDSIRRGIRIEELGAGLDRPVLYDGRDCRLMALPVLEGGKVSWR